VSFETGFWLKCVPWAAFPSAQGISKIITLDRDFKGYRLFAMKNKLLNKKVAIWVNDKDWAEFKRVSWEVFGTNLSQTVSHLIKMVNLKGDLTGLSKILMESLKPMVEREVLKEIKRVEQKHSK
jgi:hypothetical protein